MRYEDLQEAEERADALLQPLRERHNALLAEITGLKAEREALEASPSQDGAERYTAVARSLWAVMTEAAPVQRRLRELIALLTPLRGLSYDWRIAMPGHGPPAGRFFVRSFRIEEGKPVAWEPFWIEDCVRRDGPADAALLDRHATWASGGSLHSGNVEWLPPSVPTKRPFGTANEAARQPCRCGAQGYVIGSVNFMHWGEDDDSGFPQDLHLLCLACPTLTLLAERRDPSPVPKLWP